MRHGRIHEVMCLSIFIWFKASIEKEKLKVEAKYNNVKFSFWMFYTGKEVLYF